MNTDKATASGHTGSTNPVVRVGGVALIVGAIAFMAVFAFLAARFNYPAVLDGRASEVLPSLLATGEMGRTVWAIYSLLPLLWIPAGVGAFHALRAKNEGAMRAGMLFAVVSALAMTLGLMRWPSFHWELAITWSTADATTRSALDAVFNATNRYLGNYIGEFLGELSLNMFFLLAAVAMLRRGSGFARWTGWLGVVAATIGLVSMFRNTAGFVTPVAEVNNYLLPLWMIVFGIGLIRQRKNLPQAPQLIPAAA